MESNIKPWSPVWAKFPRARKIEDRRVPAVATATYDFGIRVLRKLGNHYQTIVIKADRVEPRESETLSVDLAATSRRLRDDPAFEAKMKRKCFGIEEKHGKN